MKIALGIVIIVFLVIVLYLLKSTRRIKNKTLYLETSAVNYLAEISTTDDAKATREYHLKRNNKYIISVVTIWEILMTSDELQREKLIYYCQNALYPKLLFSPEELLVNFLSEGCPVLENRKSIYTKSKLGDTWEDICSDNRKTFIFDKTDLDERTKTIRKFFKRLDKALKSTILESTEANELKQLADNIYSITEFSGKNEHSNKDIKIIKLAIIFAFTNLTFGFGLDSQPIDEFWEKKGVAYEDRHRVIVEEYSIVFTRGPFFMMGVMAYAQIEEDRKPNRGLFWDCMHSLYLPYVDLMLTRDKHFKKLQETLFHLNTIKIKLLDSESIRWRKN